MSTDFDAWKRHELYDVRNQHRSQAEKDQIEITQMEDHQRVVIRGEYVGSIPKRWKAKLVLSRLRDPEVILTDVEGNQLSLTEMQNQEKQK